MQPSNPAAGFAFARKQDNQPKTIGAKKLDFDFDTNNDDFFNSFQPQPVAQPGSNKLVEVTAETKVNDPFEMAEPAKKSGLGFDFGSQGPSNLTYLNQSEQQ